MRIIFTNIITIWFLTSCVAQDNKSNIDIIGYEQYDKETTVLIDNLDRETIPEVLKKFYYNQLEEDDFSDPQSIINENTGSRIIDLKSKQASDGYLYLTKYSREFISNHEDIVFIVGQDTINTKEKVMKLIGLKRAEIINTDTIRNGDYNLIKIN